MNEIYITILTAVSAVAAVGTYYRYATSNYGMVTKR